MAVIVYILALPVAIVLWVIDKISVGDRQNKEEVMNFGKMLIKGLLAVGTFITAYLVSNPQTILKWVPDNIENMTVGSIIAALLVMAANFFKHRNK